MINKNRENKDINSKTLIEHFFKLTGLKKPKYYFLLIMAGNIHQIQILLI
jgi:6-phosphogluconate dehydrogenase